MNPASDSSNSDKSVPKKFSPKASALRTLVLGGALPVVAFALVENFYGTIGGLIAGISFGVAEMIFEYVRNKKIQGITIISNGLVILLGGVSLLESNETFFKLQPSILLAVFAVILIFSSVIKKPFLLELARKQNPNIPPIGEKRLNGLNWRLGIVMLLLALFGVHVAYSWTTAMWATFKGIGVPVAMGIYVAIEILVIRFFSKTKF